MMFAVESFLLSFASIVAAVYRVIKWAEGDPDRAARFQHDAPYDQIRLFNLTISTAIWLFIIGTIAVFARPL